MECAEFFSFYCVCFSDKPLCNYLNKWANVAVNDECVLNLLNLFLFDDD